MSRLQEALRSGDETLATLEYKLFLKVKRHGRYPNLVQLKYDQISSPMSNPLVQEARGIILDADDDWKVIARPFDKFFNLGEGFAAPVSWPTARVLEKLDGSLMIVYFYRGEWHVATSGTPDACGPVGGHGTTFKDLFWKVWKEKGYMFFDAVDPGKTYMFELMTPLNKVVVQHTTNRLVLIGIRDTATGQEWSVQDPSLRFDTVKWFGEVGSGPEDTVKSLEAVDGLQQEGYVVVDHLFRRIKIKHPRYVLFHQMLGSLTRKKLLDTVRSGEVSEFLAYFPEWKLQADEINGLYQDLVTEACVQYEPIRDIPIQKDFALEAKKTRHSTVMFLVRAGKYRTIGDAYRDLRLETLADMIGLKKEVEDAGVQGSAE